MSTSQNKTTSSDGKVESEISTPVNVSVMDITTAATTAAVEDEESTFTVGTTTSGGCTYGSIGSSRSSTYKISNTIKVPPSIDLYYQTKSKRNKRESSNIRPSMKDLFLPPSSNDKSGSTPSSRLKDTSSVEVVRMTSNVCTTDSTVINELYI